MIRRGSELRRGLQLSLAILKEFNQFLPLNIPFLLSSPYRFPWTTTDNLTMSITLTFREKQKGYRLYRRMFPITVNQRELKRLKVLQKYRTENNRGNVKVIYNKNCKLYKNKILSTQKTFFFVFGGFECRSCFVILSQ